jgi:hypothetical protein
VNIPAFYGDPWGRGMVFSRICPEQKQMKPSSSLQIRILVGLLIGAIIAYVDNYAFHGEVNPIVIVLLLLLTTFMVGIIWKRHALITVVVLWAWLPMAHVLKHLLGVPDTLNPNTYASIFMLAIFTFVVSAIGFLCGLFINRLVKKT